MAAPILLLKLLLLAVLLVIVFMIAPIIARLTRMPVITFYLVAGLAGQLAFGGPVLRLLMPAHNGALGCITIAAGSELVVESLRAHADTIAALTCCTSAICFLFVWAVAMPVFASAPQLLGESASSDVRLHGVVAMFAGVIAVARSPSSAIAVVSELRADGPFTQTVLGVTMVTDVVVILLFSLCTELADCLLSTAPERGVADDHVAIPPQISFLLRVASELGLSVLHGMTLSALCFVVLRLPLRALRQACLLLVASYAFAAQPLLVFAMRALSWPITPRLEPMLSCIVAGFIVCNPLGERRRLTALLHSTMPPVLCFFFFTTGIGMHLGVLLRTWPMALGLFTIRLVSLAAGSYVGCVIVGAPTHFRRWGWLAYVTQAGMSLGLASEIGEKFPSWGPKLEATLVSVIVLNQLIGPPLFEQALRLAGEDGCGVVDAEEEGKLSPTNELGRNISDQMSVFDATEIMSIVPARRQLSGSYKAIAENWFASGRLSRLSSGTLGPA
uniref:Cation/H+ exchanger transmembrane domain-containing protein n=1 Tax=Chrysotila carterae TaxID=13221 RepID=A0A6S9TJV4_CHRCT